MHLNKHNVRQWVRGMGGSSFDLRCVVEMETVTCCGCHERFTDRDDLEDGYCDECNENSITEADVRSWRTHP